MASAACRQESDWQPGHVHGIQHPSQEPVLREGSQRLPRHQGQLIGPVSFGFKVVDENARPIIYNEGIRTILFDFTQRKANTQYQELSQKNQNAFVWIDEPGLG